MGLALVCLGHGYAWAQNLKIETLVSQAFSDDTNPLMLLHGGQSLWGSTTSPQITLTGKTPTTSLNWGTTINQNLFNTTAFNSTDLHTRLGFTKQNERWSLSLSGAADKDTTRTSELTPLGLSFNRVGHTGGRFSPTLAFTPTQTDRYALAGSATISTYDSKDYTDYRTYNVTPSWTHTFDQLNAGSISFLVERYKPHTGGGNVRDTLGPSLGWTGTLSERLSLNLSGGYEYSKTQGTQTTKEKWRGNSTMASSLDYKTLQDTLSLSFSRSQQPYADGTQSIQNYARFSETHGINDKLSLDMSVGYQFSDQADQMHSNFKNYSTASAGLRYKATEKLELSATAQIREEAFQSTQTKARANSVMIALTYKPTALGLTH